MSIEKQHQPSSEEIEKTKETITEEQEKIDKDNESKEIFRKIDEAKKLLDLALRDTELLSNHDIICILPLVEGEIIKLKLKLEEIERDIDRRRIEAKGNMADSINL